MSAPRLRSSSATNIFGFSLDIREADGEGSSLSLLALQLEGAVVQLDNHPGIGQAETESFHIVQISRRNSKIFLENFLLIFLFDADAFVGDDDLDGFSNVRRANRNARCCDGIFHSVVKQVTQRVGKMSCIADDHKPFCSEIQLQTSLL